MSEKKEIAPLAAIGIGVVLDMIGVGGYVLSGMESKTALIPSVFGTLLLICGFLGTNPKFLKHAMHGAAMVALLGILACTMGLVMGTLKNGFDPTTLRFWSPFSTLVLCALFMGIAIRSFSAARKRRAALAAEA
ncbi:MAG: hypothetical protein ACFBZ8_00530 [Opitutales bacterium]